MRYIPLLSDEYYHVFSRGVDKRNLFVDDRDRERFIRGLVIANDRNRPKNLPFNKDSAPREPLVEIAAYCLMGNHFHLLLRQRGDDGITSFLHRLLNSYARYFNIRYQRVGKLFDGPFKAVHVESDVQLVAVQRYIHLNPVEIIDPDWKERRSKNFSRTWEFIKSYTWSSLRHYLGSTTDMLLTPGLLDVVSPTDHDLLIASAIADT